jgi:hypothetical protein
MASTHYTGKAGQFAVMAELALRGYNVAIPEIDIGDDVFVLNDKTGQLSRIQVKTATGKKLQSVDAYRCQFSVRLSHVTNPTVQGIHYALAGRCGRVWRFLVFERGVLDHLIKNKWGTKMPNGSVMLTVVFFRSNEAKSSTEKAAVDLSAYAGNWDAWPVQI